MRLRLPIPVSVGICLLAACPGGGGSGTDTDGPDTTSTTATGTTGTTTDTPTTGEPPTTGDSASGTTTGDTSTGGTTGGDDALTDCENRITAQWQQLEWDCQCMVESGEYDDVATCLMEIDVTGDEPCLCPLLAADPGNADYLECFAHAEQALAACILALSCTDADAYSACVTTYFEQYIQCGEPTKSSVGQVDVQCYGAPSFTCGSSEKIPESYVCDLEPDCPDKSDEATDLCGTFDCGDGNSVPQDFVCDGEVDCENGSDEANCP